MRPRILFTILLTTGLLAAGLAPLAAQPASPAPQGGHRPSAQPALQRVEHAVAVLTAAAGSGVSGTVVFAQEGAGVRVTADISGLTPGKHGFHIHEFGDLRAADFTSAGSHYMAPGQAHGAPGEAMSHRGDLGNLVADAKGHARLDFVSPHLALGGPGGILGRSVVVHAEADDLSSQPTGNSGARVACGVIGLAQE